MQLNLKTVYKIISTIPIGQTRSYKWVAEKVGKPNAYRAVGQILKRNPAQSRMITVQYVILRRKEAPR